MKYSAVKNLYHHHKSIQFLLFIWRRFQCFNIPLVSASLTFTTLLALVPLFTVTIIVITAFPMFNDTATRFNDFITTVLVPAAGADSVRQYLVEFREKASGLTAIGIIFMIITSLMLIQTIERSFNQIWQVHQSRPLWIRILIYWALLTLGPLVLSTGLSTFSQVSGQSESVLHYSVLISGFHALTNLALTTLLLFLLFKLVPSRMVNWQHALLGALVTAVVLEAVRRGFAFYINHFNSYQLIYGAFAAIPVFLLWLNLLWIILLTGAVFTSSLPYWRNSTFSRLHRQDNFTDALTILWQLSLAQQQGHILTVYQLRDHVHSSESQLEQLLLRLADKRYVVETDQGWVLQTAPEHIMLDDLFYLLVYRLKDYNDITHSVNTLLQPLRCSLHISLTQWIAQSPLDNSATS
ncbi:YihY family inner membrane protein [Neisseriaceae bacterium ESL0693]|nr:YihY family inner membrane protein [Neisseriaceae bacterium ESL0693]